MDDAGERRVRPRRGAVEELRAGAADHHPEEVGVKEEDGVKEAVGVKVEVGVKEVLGVGAAEEVGEAEEDLAEPDDHPEDLAVGAAAEEDKLAEELRAAAAAEEEDKLAEELRAAAAEEEEDKLAEELRAAAAAEEEDKLAEELRAAAVNKLIKDQYQEFLLRLPPQQPQLLFRFAVVSSAWRGILTDPVFVRLYRQHHCATPQMLGLVHNRQWDQHNNAAFVNTIGAPFAPRLPNDGLDLNVLDCRHGRVLFWSRRPPGGIVMWDPLAGVHHYIALPAAFADADFPRYVLPSEPFPEAGCRSWWSAAIHCDADKPCSHANCHDLPYQVIFVGMRRNAVNLDTSVFVYRSTTSSWAPGISTNNPSFTACDAILKRASTLVDGFLFFRTSGGTLVRYQVSGEGEGALSFLWGPGRCCMHSRGRALVPAAGGKIKFATLHEQFQVIQVWETEAGAEAPVHWSRQASIPVRVPSKMILGSAEGTGEILVGIDRIVESPIIVNLNTGRHKSLMGVEVSGGVYVNTAAKRYMESTDDSLIPLLGWYTPALSA